MLALRAIGVSTTRLTASGQVRYKLKTPDLRNFFGELKRRNVYKVAAAYTVAGWLLIQVATQTFPIFDVPNWGVRLVVSIRRS